MSPERAPADPPDLPGYRYEGLLGSGGFADVYLYERDLPRMPVAVKVLVGTGLTDEARRRFTDEANTMARFQAHPYIVPILAADVSADGRPYIVMRYYPRENLSVRARREPLSVIEALAIGIQVASAVETAHRAGIVHRDIKPANILTSEFGNPGLTDFGIAATTLDGSSHGGEGLSIPWSPPEAFESEEALDERSDVYSLGATLFTLLTGRSPFEVRGGSNTAIDLMERIDRAPVPETGRGDVPPSLERVLARSMAKQPDMRHPSALAFARDLQAVEQELHLKMTTIVVPDDPRPPRVEEPDGGADETRHRMPVRLDAQAEPPATGGATRRPSQSAAPPRPARGAGDRAATPASESTSTRRRAPLVAETGEATPPEPPPPRSKIGILVGAGVLGVAVLVAILVAVLGGSSAPRPGTPTTTTQSPFPVGVVPAPTHLSAVRSGAKGTEVVVTWTDPHPVRGDFFTIVETIGGTSSPPKPVTGTRLVLADVPPSKQACFTVTTVRSAGSPSSVPSPTFCAHGH